MWTIACNLGIDWFTCQGIYILYFIYWFHTKTFQCVAIPLLLRGKSDHFQYIFTQRTLNLGWDRACNIHNYTWVCGWAIWELSPCSGSSVSEIRGSSAVCLLCLCDPLITSCTQSAVQNQPISCTKINQSAVQKSTNQLYRNQLNNCTVIDYVSYTKQSINQLYSYQPIGCTEIKASTEHAHQIANSK